MYLHEKLNLSEEQVEKISKVTMEAYSSNDNLGDAILDMHEKITGEIPDEQAKMLMFAFFVLGANQATMMGTSQK